jgi:CRISPR-associated protein Csd1
VGLVVFYEKQLAELSAVIGTEFPTRMSLPQQGSFQLGYYHQTAARYQKKEENNNV